MVFFFPYFFPLSFEILSGSLAGEILDPRFEMTGGKEMRGGQWMIVAMVVMTRERASHPSSFHFLHFSHLSPPFSPDTGQYLALPPLRIFESSNLRCVLCMYVHTVQYSTMR